MAKTILSQWSVKSRLGAAALGGRESPIRRRLGEQIEGSVEKQTFKKADRIRAKEDFDRLRKGGVRIADDTFALVFLPTTTGFSRLGIAVPKKVGGAVVRNRIKRLIREVFRIRRDRLPPSVDLLVVVRRAPEPMTLAEFSGRILALARRYPPTGGEARSTRRGETR